MLFGRDTLDFVPGDPEIGVTTLGDDETTGPSTVLLSFISISVGIGSLCLIDCFPTILCLAGFTLGDDEEGERFGNGDEDLLSRLPALGVVLLLGGDGFPPLLAVTPLLPPLLLLLVLPLLHPLLGDVTADAVAAAAQTAAVTPEELVFFGDDFF